MRFILDNDVDVACRAVLSPPHDCWTVGQAGRSDGTDADHAVYAHEKRAAFVSHDKEFASWRSQRIIGQQVRLCCAQIKGPEVLDANLPEILGVLEHRPNVVLLVKANGIETAYGWDPA